MHLANAFGLLWHSDLPLDFLAPAPASAESPDVTIRQVATLSPRIGGIAINRGWVYDNGFRFVWSDIAAFDVFEGNRIDVAPLTGWTGALPWPFYSTVAALLLAWRGQLPLHACSVAIDGTAILLCGASGAGKSSLCAGLVARGAGLLCDDLTVIAPGPAGRQALALPGRPGIRLFREIADQLLAPIKQAVPDDIRHKVMACWPDHKTGQPLPVARIIVLQDRPLPLDPRARLQLLQAQLFRPRWLAGLPGADFRAAQLRGLLATARMQVLAPLGPFSLTRLADLCAEVEGG